VDHPVSAFFAFSALSGVARHRRCELVRDRHLTTDRERDDVHRDAV
jgi:hypothetical protein